MHIALIKQAAFDVTGIQQELSAYPYPWNTITHRTDHPESPHREVSDIWVRYNPIENYRGDMREFNDVHIPKWYPVAEHLPCVKSLSEAIFNDVRGRELGAVLITRIPAGKQVYPHIDSGWHARHFDKYCLTICGNQRQSFCFKGEELRTDDGDLFWFDNAYPHWVKNDSATDRISLIVCVRGPQCH